jgi:hypothetical protein
MDIILTQLLKSLLSNNFGKSKKTASILIRVQTVDKLDGYRACLQFFLYMGTVDFRSRRFAFRGAGGEPFFEAIFSLKYS